MDKQHKKQPKENETPITDGDTRPDQVIHSEKPHSEKKKKKEVTENRNADINTAEDYKDAI